MGWGRTLLLGDLGNRLDIEDIEGDINELKRKIGDASTKTRSQETTLSAVIAENAQLKL